MSQMAIQIALEELYTRWFRMADTDGDGRVSGGEAVAFFMTKSGLPQETLGRVWDAGTNGAAFLDPGSFRRVCQLIWYAQMNGNVLPSDSAGVIMKIVSGMAVLPPPKLAGLDIPFALRDMRPIGIDMPQHSAYGTGYTGSYMSQPQYTGYSGSDMHETASTPAVPVTPKYVPSASQRFLPASDFHSGVTGAVPMSAPVTGRSFGVAATGQPEFPSITPQLATKYGGKYKEAAVTEAGGLGGAEVLRLLASVPVENLVKKDAWDLVAGNRGELTTQEFFTMLYLLDLYTVKGSFPAQLPPGIFPPAVHLCYQAAGLAVPVSLSPPTVAHVPLEQQNPIENLNLQAEGFKDRKWDMQQHAQKEEDPLAAMPPVPQKAVYEAQGSPRQYDPASRMPKIDAKRLEALSDRSQAQRLEADLKTSGNLDRQLFQAEQAFANGKEETEFYMSSLQALTLFKSKSERSLLDLQNRADAAQREAREAKQRYEQMYAAARSSASNHEELQRHITEAMATKAEWESKVQVLQHELQSLANATPELLEQLQYEVEELRGIVADMETEKQSFFDQTAGLRAAKAQLKDRTKEVQQLLHSARATKEEAMIALNTAKQELDFTKSGEDSESLVAAIQEAAAAYKALYIKAHGAGIKLPRSATIVSDDKAVWQKDDLIGAQDWMLFENEGWALVEELPDLPEGFNRTYYMAHETGEHPEEIIPVIMSDDPFIEQLDAASEDDSEAEGTRDVSGRAELESGADKAGETGSSSKLTPSVPGVAVQAPAAAARSAASPSSTAAPAAAPAPGAKPDGAQPSPASPTATKPALAATAPTPVSPAAAKAAHMTTAVTPVSPTAAKAAHMTTAVTPVSPTAAKAAHTATASAPPFSGAVQPTPAPVAERASAKAQSAGATPPAQASFAGATPPAQASFAGASPHFSRSATTPPVRAGASPKAPFAGALPGSVAAPPSASTTAATTGPSVVALSSAAVHIAPSIAAPPSVRPSVAPPAWTVEAGSCVGNAPPVAQAVLPPTTGALPGEQKGGFDPNGITDLQGHPDPHAGVLDLRCDGNGSSELQAHTQAQAPSGAGAETMQHDLPHVPYTGQEVHHPTQAASFGADDFRPKASHMHCTGQAAAVNAASDRPPVPSAADLSGGPVEQAEVQVGGEQGLGGMRVPLAADLFSGIAAVADTPAEPGPAPPTPPAAAASALSAGPVVARPAASAFSQADGGVSGGSPHMPDVTE